MQDQRAGALEVGGGEQGAHRATLGGPPQRRPLQTSGVHDGSDVVHPLLKGGQPVRWYPVGRAGAALVEQDQS